MAFDPKRKVPSTTIRLRILKDEDVPMERPALVLVPSTTIRLRILKAKINYSSADESIRSIYHDPFEDTESAHPYGAPSPPHGVPSTTIRLRILKGQPGT